MANNANVNKVVYGGQTLVDLTQDTVEPGALLAGYTAHAASGAPIEGSIQIDDEPTSGSDNLVKSGGVADAIAQSTAIPFAYDGTPGTDPFEAGGSGVILNITAPNGTIIGHLVLRPKNYSTDIGKNRALELYNASWTPIWYIDRE